MFTPEKIKSFNEVEIEMYHFTINNKKLVPYMTIREFASEVHTSAPSVLRFCRKMGYRGFTEFKMVCKQAFEQENVLNYSNDKATLFNDFLVKVDTQEYQEKLRHAAVMLSKADRIFCAGDGASGSIAYYAAMYFTASGKFANFLDGRFLKAIHQSTNDVYILFSVSGESENMINFIRKINESNGKSIVITNSEYTTMAKLADFILPYHIYNLRNSHQKPCDIEELDREVCLVDDFSTQLPAVYLVETLAKMIFEPSV
jgi:DNA-binding MurR/RpiR family transcriptional regulator